MTFRVCVVSPLYHPNLGGLGRQAQLLTERLRRAGVDLFVIARKMTLDDGVPSSSEVEVIRVPSLYPRWHILEEISVKNVMISLVFSFGCLRALVRHRKRYDIVHFHGASLPLIFSLPFLGRMEKKVVAKVAAANLGTEAGSFSGRYWFLGTLLARLVRRVDAFVAISEEIRKGLRADGVAPERIHRIDNFIDTSLFCPPGPKEKDRLKNELGYAGKMLVLYAGRLVTRKGVEHLLKAWKGLAAEHPDARLLLLGDGPLLGSLAERAEHLGITDTVCFAGRVRDVPRYLRAADLFVLPSVQEGMPNSMLEAMACGLPAVATRIGGVVDVVGERECAWLVEPGKWESLREGMSKMLAEKDFRDRLSVTALETIREKYSLESRVNRYLELYQSCMVQPNPGSASQSGT